MVLLFKQFDIHPSINILKVLSLDNMVGVVQHCFKAAKAFGEPPSNCYEDLHYIGGILPYFYWSILTSSVCVHHSICPAIHNTLQNKSSKKKNIPLKYQQTDDITYFRWTLAIQVAWAGSLRPWSLTSCIIVNNPLFVASNDSLYKWITSLTFDKQIAVVNARK